MFAMAAGSSVHLMYGDVLGGKGLRLKNLIRVCIVEVQLLSGRLDGVVLKGSCGGIEDCFLEAVKIMLVSKGPIEFWWSALEALASPPKLSFSNHWNEYSAFYQKIFFYNSKRNVWKIKSNFFIFHLVFFCLVRPISPTVYHQIPLIYSFTTYVFILCIRNLVLQRNFPFKLFLTKPHSSLSSTYLTSITAQSSYCY